MRIGRFALDRFASGGRGSLAALGLVSVALGLLGDLVYFQPTTIVLDGNSQGRIFDGFGATSADASSRLLIDCPEPQRSLILDYLFEPGYGASPQMLHWPTAASSPSRT
jgi:Glycosyl hydrolase family 59